MERTKLIPISKRYREFTRRKMNSDLRILCLLVAIPFILWRGVTRNLNQQSRQNFSDGVIYIFFN